MWRYALIATAIVLGAIALFAPLRRPQRPLEIVSVSASPAGGRAATNAPDARRSAALALEAEWALSALPECLRQCAVRRGGEAEMRARLPGRSVRVDAGSSIESASCRLIVGAGDVRVERSGDRLRVPPPAELYLLGEGLALIERRRNVTTLRTYRTRRGSGWGACPNLA